MSPPDPRRATDAPARPQIVRLPTRRGRPASWRVSLLTWVILALLAWGLVAVVVYAAA